MSDSGRYMAVTRKSTAATIEFAGEVTAVTEYTEGDTDASINGVAMLWEDTSDTLRPVSAAKPLPVGDGGGSLTVDVGTALPAGTNAIGKLAANSGVDIGDVDVTSITPGTGASNLGKTEDNAHSSADVGVAVLAVRRDSESSGVDADGDYSMLSVDSSGRLRVIVSGSGDASAENQVSGIALLTTIDADTSTLASTSVVTSDLPSGTDRGFPAMFIRDDALTDLGPTDGDWTPGKVNQRGAAWTALDTTLDATNDAIAIGSKAGQGFLVARNIDVDETEDAVKATAGTLLGYYFANLDAAAWHYVRYYNATTANVTVGTTAPVLTIPIPPNSAGHVWLGEGVAFDTAITIAATTGVADNDTGAPGANEIVVNSFYK